MSKKSINQQEIAETVTLEREKGKTDQEIYNLLTSEYYDKKGVALAITGTVKTELKEKYKLHNNLLIGLLVVGAITKVLAVFGLAAAESAWFLLLVFLAPLFNLIFAYYIARYQASIYRFCGLLTLINSFRVLTMDGVTETDIIVTLAFAAAIAALSFYLDINMFPDYKPGSLQKDENGEYILS